MTQNHKVTTQPACGEITDELAANRSWVDVSVPRIYTRRKRAFDRQTRWARKSMSHPSFRGLVGFHVSAETLRAHSSGVLVRMKAAPHAGGRRHACERPGRRPSVVSIAMADAAARVSASAVGRFVPGIAAAVLGLFWGFFFYGLIDLLAFAQGERVSRRLGVVDRVGTGLPVPRRWTPVCAECAGVRGISVSACPGGARRRRRSRRRSTQLFTPAPVRLSRTYRNGRGAGGSRDANAPGT